MSKQKLELMWVGKEKRAKLEPRILIEDPEKSYHADKRVSDPSKLSNRNMQAKLSAFTLIRPTIQARHFYITMMELNIPYGCR